MSTPTDPPSITCPKCQRTSYNPNDIREGYCGNCHAWTTEVCYLHGLEPIPDGAYLVCHECGHCFDTREDLERLALSEVNYTGDVDELRFCPLCTHNF